MAGLADRAPALSADADAARGPRTPGAADADLERRFGGLARLHGNAAYRRIRAASIAVVGVGGVGSWAAEALARSGVARLALVDLDHVAESNVQRQVQALGSTLGRAKVAALAERAADIHPGCEIAALDAFADAGNWPALLPWPVDAVIDACDQSSAKLALATWSLGGVPRVPLVVCGAAGGKARPEAVDVADLADVTHDPLLAALRQRLRRAGLGPAPGAGPVGLRCVFSREPVRPPQMAGRDGDGRGDACDVAVPGDGSLNCHGYGSTVTVTATFGLAAAAHALDAIAGTLVGPNRSRC